MVEESSLKRNPRRLFPTFSHFTIRFVHIFSRSPTKVAFPRRYFIFYHTVSRCEYRVRLLPVPVGAVPNFRLSIVPTLFNRSFSFSTWTSSVWVWSGWYVGVRWRDAMRDSATWKFSTESSSNAVVAQEVLSQSTSDFSRNFPPCFRRNVRKCVTSNCRLTSRYNSGTFVAIVDEKTPFDVVLSKQVEKLLSVWNHTLEIA